MNAPVKFQQQWFQKCQFKQHRFNPQTKRLEDLSPGRTHMPRASTLHPYSSWALQVVFLVVEDEPMKAVAMVLEEVF